MKIVGYSPYSQWMLHGLWHISMLHGLRLRGNDVKYVLCDGLYKACDMHRSKLPRNEMSCYKCQQIVSEQAYKHWMPFEWLGRYIYPSEIKIAENWCNQFDSSNLFDAKYDSWEIGTWIKSSVHTHFRITHPDLTDPKIAETVRMYLSSGLIACFALNRLMDDYLPDILLLFNGRMSSTRIALELALKKGIRVISHERGARKQSLKLRKNAASLSMLELHKAWDEWKDVPLSKDEVIEIKSFLNNRMYGKDQNWVTHSPPPENIDSLRKKLSLPDHNRPLFILFNSSDDEIIASIDKPGPFKKQIDWIMHTIAFARLHPEIDVILRIHPNIAGKKAIIGNNFQQLYEILELKPILPQNVRLVMPDDSVSSYSLMSMADVGLVYRSTAGLEMACQGKPVVIADNCILSDKPFLITVKSHEHYNKILNSFIEKKTNCINTETIRIAHRFAYTLFFRNSIFFPLVKMTNTFEGKVAYDSIDELLPGKNPHMDKVMRIILEDEDIIQLPKKIDRNRSAKFEDAILANYKSVHKNNNLSDNIDDQNFELMKHLKNKLWNHKFPVYSKKFQYVKFLNKIVQPKISIVVVSWRLHPDTLKNFEILQQQRDQNFELIFVNNGADDEEFKTLGPFIDTYVKLNDNTGPCFARNFGSVFAKAPIVCFLEDDGIPEKNFVAAHFQAFKQHDIVGLRGVYRPKTDNPLNQKAKHYYLGDRPFPSIINLEGNASFKSKLFFQSGGWDEDIFIMGDGLALSMRLLQMESDLKKQIYYPEAIIYHDYARDEEHLKNKMVQLEKSMAIIRKKYKNYDIVRKIWNTMNDYTFLRPPNNTSEEKSHFCPICKKWSPQFDDFGKKTRKNVKCPNCGSLERHRFVWIYLQDKLNILRPQISMLHFAPEQCIESYLRNILKNNYKTADLFKKNVDFKVDITNIQFQDETYDLIFCSHVLEHVQDDLKAIHEMHRILKIHGRAIIMVPIKGDITQEDLTITDPSKREILYGQSDHVRMYGIDISNKLKNVGFKVTIINPDDLLDENLKNILRITGGQKIFDCEKNCKSGDSDKSQKNNAHIHKLEKTKETEKTELKISSYIISENTPLIKKLCSQLKTIGWSHKKDLYSPCMDVLIQNKGNNNPAISIIVISWRLHPDTIKNFQILEKQRDQNFELIFVDNGGKPGEFNELKPYVDTYVRLNTNTGAYLARNVGAVFAKSPILFFLEDDGIPAENIIQAHLDAHEKYDVIAVRGVYLPKTENPLNSMARHYYLGEKPYPRFGDLEGNISYKAESFFRGGGWDDKIIFGHGGIDLCYRLLQIDPDMRKYIYHPDPVIHHDYVIDEQHFAEKRKKQSRSWEYLKHKHGSAIEKFFACWDKFIAKDKVLLTRQTTNLKNEQSLKNLAEYYLKKGKTAKANAYLRMAKKNK